MTGEPPVTPSERERRIDAAARALHQAIGRSWDARMMAIDALDAADKAVPVVSEEIVNEMVWLRREEQREALEQRAERAEAAAGDLKSQLGGIAGTLDTPTSLFGRDEATQLAEFRRRVAQAVSMLDRLAGIDIQRQSKSDDWPSFSGEEGTGP